MRRPLLIVALCLVMITAIRLNYGWVDAWSPACGEGGIPYANAGVEVTGQVYQKDSDSICIKSVVLCDSSNSIDSGDSEVSVADSQQQISNLICEVKNAETIPLGSMVRLSGVFVPFREATNPGEFDSAVYYRTLGIVGRLKESELLERGEKYWAVREVLFDLKSQLQERLYSAFAPEYAAIMETLLLGEKGNLDGGIKELYKRSGILHILSISSLHITIIGMSVYKLLRRVGCPIWAAAVAGAVLLFLYGFMTGFSVSATRAIWMYLIRMLAEVVGRTYDMLTALGVVAAVMVVRNPYYLQNGGFLLSFSCVLGIGVVYPALLPEFERRQNDNRQHKGCMESLKEKIAEREPGKRMVKAFLAGLSVTLATLPIQLWLYYETPVWSVFLNLLVIPLLEPLMLFGMLALAVPKMGLFGGAASMVLQWYEYLCRSFEKLPFCTWNPGCPKLWQIVLYYILLGLVIVTCYCGKRRVKRKENQERYGDSRKRKKCHGQLMYIMAACIMGVAVWTLGNHAPVRNQVFFLDVGQGDCILVQTASGENYLFDCGSSSRSKVGKYVLLPFLKYYGIQMLDGVFVSHADEDHVNGIIELLEIGEENHIVVKQLVLPYVAEETMRKDFATVLKAAENTTPTGGISVRYIARGDAWSVGSAEFLCLNPKRHSEEDSNAYSQCFLVRFFGEEKLTEPVCNLLLTGDIGEAEERELAEMLGREGGGALSVLKVAHHGSRYSNSEAFLQTIRPTVAVISCSRDNAYGHPHEETLERLHLVGSKVLATPEYGALKIEMGEEIKVYGY